MEREIMFVLMQCIWVLSHSYTHLIFFKVLLNLLRTLVPSHDSRTMGKIIKSWIDFERVWGEQLFYKLWSSTKHFGRLWRIPKQWNVSKRSKRCSSMSENKNRFLKVMIGFELIDFICILRSHKRSVRHTWELWAICVLIRWSCFNITIISVKWWVLRNVSTLRVVVFVVSFESIKLFWASVKLSCRIWDLCYGW